MKTTIELSDALVARMHKVIAARHTTVRHLVEEGLSRVLDEQEDGLSLDWDDIQGLFDARRT